MSTKHTSLGRTARAAALWIAAVFGLGALPAAFAIVVAPGEAHAVVGRPLTPVSYAGVARRTSRRTTRRVVGATAATTAAMTTLPAGCVAAGAVYTCGAVRYQQVVDGGNVVYVQVN